MDSSKLTRFTELKQEKERLEGELQLVAHEMEGLERELLGEFERDGIQNIKINGSTVYLHRQLWARAKEGNYPRAVQALELCGVPEFVEKRFNANTVSAWIREQDRDGQELPEVVRSAFDVEEKFSIRIRKGA